ncbi:hypothetical protein Sjap_011685 [Stephania japonica]|uniref:Uncharacterized protein n=1 Tax=Stephania japonica TaxID=461633 RepID=A0AAP0P584_9MAGN
MATSSSSLLVLFPLLMILTFNVSAYAGEPEEVRDISRNKLISGVEYYILPAHGGAGGGLSLAYNMNQSCPLEVVQEDYDYSKGLPTVFLPVNSKKGMVRVSTDLNIKLNAEIICDQTMVWKLGSFDKEVGQYFVATGGIVGNPGVQTMRNWFKIEKYEDDYKLSYCPSVCRFCKVMCKDIGIYEDGDGVKRLALSETPFKVIFQKV